jgi:hypothetical protein
MFIRVRGLLVSVFVWFEDGAASEGVCERSPLGEALFESDDAGVAEGGGPPSFANRRARICSIFSLSGASPDHDGGWSFGSMAAAGGIGAAASKENNVLG